MAVGLIATFGSASTGCFASFKLVNKVYDFNKGVGGKPLQEVVFLAFVILPVYGLATFVDAIVLNTIEFWTGSNPLSMHEGETKEKRVQIDGEQVRMRIAKHAGATTLEISSDGSSGWRRTIRVDEAGAVMADDHGQVLSQVALDANGGMVVWDGSGADIITRDAAAVAQLTDAAAAGPAALLDAHRAASEEASLTLHRSAKSCASGSEVASK